MKHFLLFTTLTFILFSCTNKDFKINTDARLQNNLNGAVKSLTFETFNVDSLKDGEIIIGQRTRSKNLSPTITDYSTGNYRLTFTRNGDLEELIVSGTRGQQNNKYIAYYDKENRLIANERIDYSENDTTYGERIYKGNVIEAITKDKENNLIYKMTLLHDKLNRLEYTETIDANKNIIAKAKYKYKGDLQISKFYDKSEKLIRELVRDSNGNMIKEISARKLYYEYDNENFLVSIREKNKLSKNIRYDYLNDEKGNVISIKKWKDKMLMKSCQFEYEYDKNNNWIKRIMYEDENPIVICLRKIEYY